MLKFRNNDNDNYNKDSEYVQNMSESLLCIKYNSQQFRHGSYEIFLTKINRWSYN